MGLIAQIPARYALPDSDRLQTGGTVWNGEAVLGSVMRIEWHWSPIETLARHAFTADWHMTGGDTDLVGLVTPGRHSLRLTGVSGQADGTLLAAAAPDLPFQCNFLAQVDVREVRAGGEDQQAAGGLRTSTVRCTARMAAGASLDLPPLRAMVDADRNGGPSSGALVTGSSHQHLIELRWSRGGAFSLWPTPALMERAPMLIGRRWDTTISW